MNLSYSAGIALQFGKAWGKNFANCYLCRLCNTFFQVRASNLCGFAEESFQTNQFDLVETNCIKKLQSRSKLLLEPE